MAGLTTCSTNLVRTECAVAIQKYDVAAAAVAKLVGGGGQPVDEAALAAHAEQLETLELPVLKKRAKAAGVFVSLDGLDGPDAQELLVHELLEAERERQERAPWGTDGRGHLVLRWGERMAEAVFLGTDTQQKRAVFSAWRLEAMQAALDRQEIRGEWLGAARATAAAAASLAMSCFRRGRERPQSPHDHSLVTHAVRLNSSDSQGTVAMGTMHCQRSAEELGSGWPESRCCRTTPRPRT